jgi:hypothetical protein
MSKEKIKNFREKCDVIYHNFLNKTEELINNFNKVIEELEYISFGNEHKNWFCGDDKNLIFIYLTDSYSGNNNKWIEFGKLFQDPHTEPADRGYISGIAVDLNNYLILTDIYCTYSSMFDKFENSLKLYSPKVLKKYEQDIRTLIYLYRIKFKDYFLEKSKDYFKDNLLPGGILSYFECNEDKLIYRGIS